jgi:hypothetical protein
VARTSSWPPSTKTATVPASCICQPPPQCGSNSDGTVFVEAETRLEAGTVVEGVLPLRFAPRVSAGMAQALAGDGVTEVLLDGPRQTGKTQACAGLLLALAEKHARAGYPLPLLALWLHSTARNGYGAEGSRRSERVEICLRRVGRGVPVTCARSSSAKRSGFSNSRKRYQRAIVAGRSGGRRPLVR